MLKKVLIYLFLILFLTGCSFTKNTPFNKVDEFLSKYKSLDNDVIDDLAFNAELTGLLKDDLKEEYEKVIKRQYTDLKYGIENEIINGDEAEVTVNINVYDFYKVEKEVKQYRLNHLDEFENESEYYNYLLKNMLETKERVDYTITINLVKNEEKWQVKEMSNSNMEKLHGMYNYEN